MVKSQRCCCNKRPSCNKRGCGGRQQRNLKVGRPPQSRAHKNNNKKSNSEKAMKLTAGGGAIAGYPHLMKLAAGENPKQFKLAAGGRLDLEQRHHNNHDHNPNLDGGTALICRPHTSQDLGIGKQERQFGPYGWGGYPGWYGPGWGWWSDRRLKHSIEQLDKSPSGIPIYSFKYNQDVKSDLPSGTWSGVMAQDLLDLGHEDAVTLTEEGFYAVDYSQLDVKFEPIM